ncbi:MULTISPECIES: NinE family protein [Pantoea]|uniref:NinE family protein n=1 Tax=Pantoea TaxID=53335 RepID=UPI00117EB9B4
MRRQISITFLACEHAKLKYPRQKRRHHKIPTESEVTTCNYVARLRRAVADRMRKTR